MRMGARALLYAVGLLAVKVSIGAAKFLRQAFELYWRAACLILKLMLSGRGEEPVKPERVLLSPEEYPGTPPHGSAVVEAECLRQKGNAAYAVGKFDEAVRFYSGSILLNPTEHTVYSNRSACWLRLERPIEALDDAELCVKICGSFAKGYLRKGAAEQLLSRRVDAQESFRKGLGHDPESAALNHSFRDLRTEMGAGLQATLYHVLFVSPHLQMERLFQVLEDPDSLTSTYVEQHKAELDTQFECLTQTLGVDVGLLLASPVLRDAYDRVTFACGQLLQWAPEAVSKHLGQARRIVEGLGLALRCGWRVHHGVAKFSANALTILATSEGACDKLRREAVRLLLGGMLRWLLDPSAEPEDPPDDRDVCGCTFLCPRLSAATWLERLFEHGTRVWVREECERFPDIVLLVTHLCLVVRDERAVPLGLPCLLRLPGVAKDVMSSEVMLDLSTCNQDLSGKRDGRRWLTRQKGKTGPSGVATNVASPTAGPASGSPRPTGQQENGEEKNPADAVAIAAAESGASSSEAAPFMDAPSSPARGDAAGASAIGHAYDGGHDDPLELFASSRSTALVMETQRLPAPTQRLGEWMMASLGYLLVFIDDDALFAAHACSALRRLAISAPLGVARLTCGLWMGLPLLERLSALACQHTAALELLETLARQSRSTCAAMYSLANSLAVKSHDDLIEPSAVGTAGSSQDRASFLNTSEHLTAKEVEGRETSTGDASDDLACNSNKTELAPTGALGSDKTKGDIATAVEGTDESQNDDTTAMEVTDGDGSNVLEQPVTRERVDVEGHDHENEGLGEPSWVECYHELRDELWVREEGVPVFSPSTPGVPSAGASAGYKGIALASQAGAETALPRAAAGNSSFVAPVSPWQTPQPRPPPPEVSPQPPSLQALNLPTLVSPVGTGPATWVFPQLSGATAQIASSEMSGDRAVPETPKVSSAADRAARAANIVDVAATLDGEDVQRNFSEDVEENEPAREPSPPTAPAMHPMGLVTLGNFDVVASQVPVAGRLTILPPLVRSNASEIVADASPLLQVNAVPAVWNARFNDAVDARLEPSGTKDLGTVDWRNAKDASVVLLLRSTIQRTPISPDWASAVWICADAGAVAAVVVNDLMDDGPTRPAFRMGLFGSPAPPIAAFMISGKDGEAVHDAVRNAGRPLTAFVRSVRIDSAPAAMTRYADPVNAHRNVAVTLGTSSSSSSGAAPSPFSMVSTEVVDGSWVGATSSISPTQPFPPKWPLVLRAPQDIAQAWSLLETVHRAAPSPQLATELSDLATHMGLPEKRVWLTRRLQRYHRGDTDADDPADPQLAFVDCDRDGDHLLQLRKQLSDRTGLAAHDITGEFEVRFREESSVGSAVMREWMDVLAHQAFLPANKHLLVSYDNGATFLPDPAAPFINSNWRGDFELLGRLLGLAFWHQVTLDLPIHPYVCKLLLNDGEMPRPGFEEDSAEFARIDEELHKHKIQWLLSNNVSELGFDMPFTDMLLSTSFGEADLPLENLPPLPEIVTPDDVIPGLDQTPESFRLRRFQPTQVALCLGGEQRVVTEENKKEFVTALLEWRLRGSMRGPIEEMLRGLRAAMPSVVLEEARRMLGFDEVHALLVGSRHIDVDDWERNTRIAGGLTPASQEVRWFWQTLRQWAVGSTEDRLQDLLQFATGSRRVPVGGFAQLVGFNGGKHLFTLVKGVHLTSKSLPTSHACICTIDLPPWESLEAAQQKLLAATEAGRYRFDEGTARGGDDD